MSARKPTPEQQAAIDAAGEVLVSASAGSGKTFVMIEKMISLILSGKAEVSSVLAVTFTKAAAAEMKERLRSAIVARINETKEDPVRARLKYQLAEIGTADICTLHSFCTNVIRRYFYHTDIDGGFRVADEAETEKLKSRAVSLAFERLLAEKSPKFALLCRVFAGGRGFGKLGDILLKSYEKAIVRADFEQFLRDLPARYDEEHFSLLADEALAPVRRIAARLKERCAALDAECAPFVESGAFDARYPAYIAARLLLAEDILAAGDVFAAAACIKDLKLISKPPNTKLKNAGDVAALALDERLSSLKEEVDALKKALSAFRSREEERAAFFASGEVAAALCELILTFAEIFRSLKRRAGVLDFSDLEHESLRLLEIPAVREEVRARYSHVFVDEYQDVNPAQERILSLVSGENVFMVGDAKQSIYGFRGCSADFFARKYARLAAEGRALTLNGNFRSCEKVLQTVNGLFSGVMTEETCSVDYAKTSMMIAGSVAQAGGEVRFEFVPEREEAEKAERGVYSVAEHLSPQEDEEYAEGALIANIVLSEAGRLRPDPATGEPMRIGYGDIVVLTRGKTEKAGRIVGELVRRGIPVASAAEVNICDYAEIKTLTAILQYLDNGLQDIPLAAALKSDMGGITDEELAKIRLSVRQEESFSFACEDYAVKNSDALSEKLRAFRARAERYRLLSAVKGAAEVLAAILAETGMELTLLSQSCGEEKVRRVRRFIAEAGELTVPEFLEKLKSGGNSVGFSESGGENAVRVMTMHASKGLEFPVIIVAGLNGRFSAEDMRGILFDDEWGFAPPAFDLAAYTAEETVLRTVIRARLRRKRAEDEMRLLYVALTRAKSCLHLVFETERPFNADAVSDASCFADFVDFEKFRDLYAPVFGGDFDRPAPRVLATGETDEEVKAAVLSRYARPYPHENSVKLEVKTSASAIVKDRSEGHTRPQFAEEEGEERAAGEFYESAADAETGVAYHAALERADFSAPPAEEAARLCVLLRAEYPALDEARLREILSMPVFGRLNGYALWRERAFLLSAPACEVLETDAQDELLVQGVIDLMAVRGEECVIVDYKYSAHGAAQLKETYAPQLRVYAAAARRLPNIKKVRTHIVNILRGFEIEISV